MGRHGLSQIEPSLTHLNTFGKPRVVLMPSLGPRPKTNPSVNRFQYHVRVILEAIYAPDEVWGRSRLVNAHMRGLYPTLHLSPHSSP